MTQDVLFQHVVPAIGCVASNAVAFSSISAVLKIRKRGTLETFDPNPLVFCFLSGIAQILYSFSIRDYYCFIGTLPGFMVITFSLLTALGCTDITQARRNRIDFTLWLGLSAIFITAFVAHIVLMPNAIGPNVFSLEQASAVQQKILGTQGVVFLILFMASPLGVIAQVLRERNSIYFFWPLAVTNLLSSGLWGTYGAMKGDIFITGSNVLGVLLAVVQIACCLIFSRVEKPKTSALPISTKTTEMTQAVHHDSDDEADRKTLGDDYKYAKDDSRSEVSTLGGSPNLKGQTSRRRDSLQDIKISMHSSIARAQQLFDEAADAKIAALGHDENLGASLPDWSYADSFLQQQDLSYH